MWSVAGTSACSRSSCGLSASTGCWCSSSCTQTLHPTPALILTLTLTLTPTPTLTLTITPTLTLTLTLTVTQVLLDLHATVAGRWPDDGKVGSAAAAADLKRAWGLLAATFCDARAYPHVFGADLKNEPHGMFWGAADELRRQDAARPGAARQAAFEYAEQDRWDTLASALGAHVLSLCPRWLIFVEGVGHCMQQTTAAPAADANGDATAAAATGGGPCQAPSAVDQRMSVATWWGENLQGAAQYPVALPLERKLVYSPHVYGPSVANQDYFNANGFPSNMPSVWALQWARIPTREDAGTPPVVLGEWGGRLEGKDATWQQAMATFLADSRNRIAGSFYWCLNPDSGDTGGLLTRW